MFPNTLVRAIPLCFLLPSVIKIITKIGKKKKKEKIEVEVKREIHFSLAMGSPPRDWLCVRTEQPKHRCQGWLEIKN